MRYERAPRHEHFCLGCSKRWQCTSPYGCEDRWRSICLTCLEERMRKTEKGVRTLRTLKGGGNVSQMTTRTLLLTLSLCTLIGFLFTLLLYAFLGGNPLNRIGYGVFVSVLPAIASFALLKLIKLRSRRAVAIIYFVLFLLIANLQGCMRTL